MGILIGCEAVSHEWPGKQVLNGVTLSVNEGDRIGIVGHNGDGKTTLLEILSKTIEPDSGSVTFRGGTAVGFLGQQDTLDSNLTVRHEVVGDVPDYVWASNPTTREIIDSLLGDVDLDAKVGTLSGGQRRRVDLARILIGDWDVLMLDEPTNHLDVVGISWLASHLRNRWAKGAGALLCVTHDRWFLDEVCEEMWEVHDGVVDPFEGGYSAYIQQRLERQRQAEATEARRQNMIRKELAWLSRGAQARSTKPKFRVAEAQEMIADVPPLRDGLELKRLAVSRLGKQVVEMKNVSVDYGSGRVLDEVTWLVGPGDRYGILGTNGAGKSTLLRVLTGVQRPTSGRVKIGKSVRFGMMSQGLDTLDDKSDWRVRDLLGRYKRTYRIDGKDVTPEKLLERLGFDKRELMTEIGSLSGGQRRRLALMCVLLDEPNVLVLDEPGNDLDTDMLAIMEDLLDTWPGTLFLVTHDRYLMERVTDDQFALVDGHLRHVPRGVDEFLEIISRKASRSDAGPADGDDANGDAQVQVEIRSKEMGLTNSERRELKKQLDATTRRLRKAEGRPDEVRAKMGAADPTDYEALRELQDELETALNELEELEDRWLELTEELGEA